MGAIRREKVVGGTRLAGSGTATLAPYNKEAKSAKAHESTEHEKAEAAEMKANLA